MTVVVEGACWPGLVNPPKRYATWKRCEPDGTSWAYWVLGAETTRDGGFVIETKPRFRRLGYWLFLPAGLSIMGGFGIDYRTLGEAKAAAYLPAGELVKLHKAAIAAHAARWIALCGSNMSEREWIAKHFDVDAATLDRVFNDSSVKSA